MDTNIDKQILALINDDKSFDKGITLLIKTHQERLYWHIRRIVNTHENADDVLQNVFIKVFKNIKGFKGDSNLYTWMYRIATNESITYLNKLKKKMEVEDIDVLQTTPISEPYFDGDAATLLLKKAINTLPEKQKIVFNLRYYDEMSYKEMSSILDTSIGALKASFHHATKKIESYLNNNIQTI